MGYAIRLKAVQFSIEEENLVPALQALKDLAQEKTLDWVYKNEVLDADNLAQAMFACRWEPAFYQNKVVDLDFEGEKSGSEDLIFKALAPYVDSGSFIQVIGEDGYHFGWGFENGKLKSLVGELTWTTE